LVIRSGHQLLELGGGRGQPEELGLARLVDHGHEVTEALASRRLGGFLRRFRWLEDAVPLEERRELDSAGRTQGELLDEALGIGGDEGPRDFDETAFGASGVLPRSRFRPCDRPQRALDQVSSSRCRDTPVIPRTMEKLDLQGCLSPLRAF